MPVRFEDILRLPPDIRVRVLKQLEEHLRKLISRHEKAIDVDKREIDEAEELLRRAQQELRVLEEVQTPEPKKAKTEEILRHDQQLKSLEEQLTDVKLSPKQELAATVQAQKPTEEAYRTLKDIYAATPSVEKMNDYQRNKFYEAVGTLQHRLQDAVEGNKPLTEAERAMLGGAQKIIAYERGEPKDNYQR